MQIFPIIIPQETRRDCIVVNSKTYCEESHITIRELGSAILFFTLIILYIIGVCYESDRKDNGWIIVGGIFGPALLIGLIFLVFG